MPLDADFVADALYDENALFLEDIVEVDREGQRLVATMTPRADLPLTANQRVVPGAHPRHVNGGLMVHLTGVLGLAHGYYCLDVRHRDGWVGFGAGIHGARYPSMAVMDEPMRLVAETVKVRMGASRVMARYRFEFAQSERTVFASEQSAMWVRERTREASTDAATPALDRAPR